jgi:hypothetical protein
MLATVIVMLATVLTNFKSEALALIRNENGESAKHAWRNS